MFSNCFSHWYSYLIVLIISCVFSFIVIKHKVPQGRGSPHPLHFLGKTVQLNVQQGSKQHITVQLTKRCVNFVNKWPFLLLSFENLSLTFRTSPKTCPLSPLSDLLLKTYLHHSLHSFVAVACCLSLEEVKYRLVLLSKYLIFLKKIMMKYTVAAEGG